MYKDPDKQREANRQAQAKFKARAKLLGITKQGDTLGITGGIADRIEGITEQANIPIDKREQVPERTPGGHIRVSKPGDADYDGVGVA